MKRATDENSPACDADDCHCPAARQAQATVPKAEQDSLNETVTALDAKLFTAYNECDLKTLGSMVSDDLEFYHDQTGLINGRQAFLDATRKYICGKVQRTIVPGTMEVDVLHHYGAVEQVTHRFHHPEIAVRAAKRAP